MSAFESDLYILLAAAFVRGRLASLITDESLSKTALKDLSLAQIESLLALGKAHDLKLHKFKKSMGLPRVRSVLGILRGLQPTQILDLGTGRGAFLWPLLDEFPELQVTCVDENPIRVRDIQAVSDGGLDRLKAIESDICKLDLPEHSFDVVTFLESLEHISDAQAALNKAVALARRFIVLSVPSHEDDNEEHIHLFDRKLLDSMLLKAGAEPGKAQYVLNHMIVLAKVLT
ncbi:MAG: class I SAM-dependent methyltransferase [Candidatus Obscuribacterales bacterium]|nr:class I SAM-dependent methyltransferase [Candidatus Obscuribacterales bacterium]